VCELVQHNVTSTFPVPAVLNVFCTYAEVRLDLMQLGEPLDVEEARAEYDYVVFRLRAP
jgi:hypothetical protein